MNKIAEKHLPKEIRDKLEELKQTIEWANTIAIFWHEEIDWDSIWACLGFGGILESMGKSVSYYTSLAPEENYTFVPWVEKFKTAFDYGEYDLICFIDFAWYDRINLITHEKEEYFDIQKKVVIDHHIWEQNYPNALILKDVTSSSSCWFTYEIISLLRPELISSEIASALYLWVLTDTGNFKWCKNPPRDYHIAAEIVKYNVDHDFYIKNLFHSLPSGILQTANLLLGRSAIIWDIVYTRYTEEESIMFWFSKDELETINSLIRGIKDIPVFVKLKKISGLWTGGLRSWRAKNGSRTDVQKIASSFEKWWGHRFASWFSTQIESTLSDEENIRKIIQHIQKEIDKQKNS